LLCEFTADLLNLMAELLPWRKLLHHDLVETNEEKPPEFRENNQSKDKVYGLVRELPFSITYGVRGRLGIRISSSSSSIHIFHDILSLR
jgi:hypothetical protein